MIENQFKYGYVIGMFVSSIGDRLDAGRFPDVIPADVTVTFTRVRGQYKQPLDGPVNGVKSMVVNHKPVTAMLTKEGYLTSDFDPIRKFVYVDATPGIWLVAGLYKVSVGGLLPDFEIQVTEDYTPESPLDIADWISYSAPPGSAVKVVSVPVGSDGQLMQWESGGIVWKDREILQGPPNTLSIGTVTSADTPSATITGTSPNQELSLILPKGDKGDQGVSIQNVTSAGETATVELSDGSSREISLPQGETGPAPSIKIGSVTSGPTASATVSGVSPDLTLGLVLPKGDKGDTGAPGALANASSYVLIGPGRPDQPATTGGIITGSEPVGSEYRSQDGAQVGAWVWMKRPTGWVVIDGDTGWRDITATATFVGSNATGTVQIKRVNSEVYARFWGINVDKPTSGFNTMTVYKFPIGGFSILGQGSPSQTNTAGVGVRYSMFGLGENLAEIGFMREGNILHVRAYAPPLDPRRSGWTQWPTEDSWPTTLPGITA